MNSIQKLTGCTLVCIVAGQQLGCSHGKGILGVDKCANIPCGAVPAPVGSKLCNWQSAQVASASIDQGVFYQADFVGNTSELGPAARKHVDEYVQRGMVGRLPIIVEPSGNEKLDSIRQASLLSAFSNAGAQLEPDSITIAYPPALGLDSFRAQQVARTASRSGTQGGGQGGGQNGGGGGMGMSNSGISGGIF